MPSRHKATPPPHQCMFTNQRKEKCHLQKETRYDGVTVISHGMPDPNLIHLAAVQLLRNLKGEKENAA